MSIWEKIKAAAAETPAQAKQRALEAQVAQGNMVQCPDCLTIIGKQRATCPLCERDMRATDAPRRTQIVKVYRGNDPVKAFAADAAKLAQAGWRVASQSQGGSKAWHYGANVHAAEMTVIYARD